MRAKGGLLLATCVAALVASARPAWAPTATANFNVTITIQDECTISATTLDFGTNPGVITANIDNQNTISVTCTNTTPWTITLSTGGAGVYNPRKMTGPGAATIDYNIYRDAARTQIWGDPSVDPATFAVTGTGTGSAQAQTGYGRVPPQSAPTPGAYSDSITATVTF